MRPSQPNLTPNMDATTAWISVDACARWTNCLTTGGESVGWSFQAGDELLRWAIRTLYSGQSVQWTIHAGRSVGWTIRKWVKQPYTKIFVYVSGLNEIA